MMNVKRALTTLGWHTPCPTLRASNSPTCLSAPSHTPPANAQRTRPLITPMTPDSAHAKAASARNWASRVVRMSERRRSDSSTA